MVYFGTCEQMVTMCLRVDIINYKKQKKIDCIQRHKLTNVLALFRLHNWGVYHIPKGSCTQTYTHLQ
jgi:hypothetical protein